MKTKQKFEKVVEYDQEPDWFNVGLFTILSGAALIGNLFWFEETYQRLIALVCFGVFGVGAIVNCGLGRTVYWRPIK